MKIALCLSGHLRGYNRVVQLLKQQGDIFIATWDCIDLDNSICTEKAVSEFEPINFSIDSFELINEIHKTKYLKIQEHAQFGASWHKDRHGWDSYSMFYLLKKSQELRQLHEIENNFRYDIVIRFRPDYLFRGFNPHELEENTIYSPDNANYLGMTDNLMYGTSATMDKVAMCYDLMDLYLLIHKAEWVNEKLMYHHLQQCDLKINQVPGFTYERIQHPLTLML